MVLKFYDLIRLAVAVSCISRHSHELVSYGP